MYIEQAVDIKAGPDQVWPYIEDPDKTTQWMSELVENDLTSEGEVAVGSTFLMKLKEGSRVGEYRAEVVEHERPRRFKLEMKGASLGDTPMVVGYTLKDLGDGRTRLEYTSELGMKGFLWKLLNPLLELLGRKRVAKHLENLKQLAEAR